MTDAMIIEGLHKISLKFINDMRFQESDIIDQAIARIMSIPKVAARIEQPSIDAQIEQLARWTVEQYKEQQ